MTRIDIETSSQTITPSTSQTDSSNSHSSQHCNDTNNQLQHNERTTLLRIAHSRFSENVPTNKSDNKFDRVVTSVWTFDVDTKVLVYAATNFKKQNCRDHWNKSQHLERALERFHSCPIRVQLKCADGQLLEISNMAMDWYISRKLVYLFGTHNKSATPDVRRIHHQKTLKADFNQKFHPFYRDEKYRMVGSVANSGTESDNRSIICEHCTDMHSSENVSLIASYEDPIYNPMNGFFLMMTSAFSVMTGYYVLTTYNIPF